VDRFSPSRQGVKRDKHLGLFLCAGGKSAYADLEFYGDQNENPTDVNRKRGDFKSLGLF